MAEMTQTPFNQQLAFFNRGSLNDELTEAMADVVKSVRETGKQGTITLTLKVSMLNKRDEDAVKITPSIKSTKPELDRAETIMWSTADGDLLRNDPHQNTLDLQVVPTTDTGKGAPLQAASR
ncbi:MAG: hypothetical protein LRY38_01480 [Aeromonadaceae bacterium]|nr:hypothetical protein [Aeromonadaceae bacterium]